MNKFLKLTIIVFVAVAVLTQAVSIYLSNTKSLESIEATQLRAKVNEVSESNMELSVKLLSLSSYNDISSRAAELGYKKNSEIVSLYDPVTVARSR